MKKNNVVETVYMLAFFAVWVLNFFQQWSDINRSIRATERNLEIAKKDLVDLYKMQTK